MYVSYIVTYYYIYLFYSYPLTCSACNMDELLYYYCVPPISELGTQQELAPKWGENIFHINLKKKFDMYESAENIITSRC